MRKKTIGLLLIVFLLVLSCTSADSQSSVFYAVYMNKGFYSRYWANQNIQYYVEATDWSKFDKFCKEVRDRAGDQTIVIDIDCHGDDRGLWIEDDYITADYEFHQHLARATMGFISNTIDKDLPIDHLTLLTEACFSGRAYKNTIRNNHLDLALSSKVENHAAVPNYPIYGVGSQTINAGNLIFLEYLHPEERPYFVDLRTYETEPLGPIYEESAPITEQIEKEYEKLRGPVYNPYFYI